MRRRGRLRRDLQGLSDGTTLGRKTLRKACLSLSGQVERRLPEVDPDLLSHTCTLRRQR